MNLDVNNGFVTIDNYSLELSDLESLKNSSFYKHFSPLTTLGPFYLSIDDIFGEINSSFWNWDQHFFFFTFDIPY